MKNVENVSPPSGDQTCETAAKDETKPKKRRTKQATATPTGSAPKDAAPSSVTAVDAPPTATLPNETLSGSVNLLTLLDKDSGATGPSLELVRLGTDETPVIPFTPQAERVTLHYCSEPEVSGYVRCNGSGCVLCRIGRRRDERLLIPVYLPASGAVGVLPVSPSIRPHALFPQLGAVLKAGNPVVAFITRDRDKFTVATSPIAPDVDAGETVIHAFLADHAAGRIKLSSVIAAYTNEQFAGVPAIARMLSLKCVA